MNKKELLKYHKINNILILNNYEINLRIIVN